MTPGSFSAPELTSVFVSRKILNYWIPNSSRRSTCDDAISSRSLNSQAFVFSSVSWTESCCSPRHAKMNAWECLLLPQSAHIFVYCAAASLLLLHLSVSLRLSVSNMRVRSTVGVLVTLVGAISAYGKERAWTRAGHEKWIKDWRETKIRQTFYVESVPRATWGRHAISLHSVAV